MNGSIIEFKNNNDGEEWEKIAVMVDNTFTGNGSQQVIGTVLFDNAALDEKTGFHMLGYNDACVACCELVGSLDLLQYMKDSTRGNFPVGVYQNAGSIVLVSVNTKSINDPRYWCTRFFRISGDWVRSYDLRDVTKDQVICYIIESLNR